ncbi:hypothetical protein [Streptomyces sp. Tu 2975]|uniref:hypothetical protein n=1 Tax=Streptomyces sp. Tu 2975 TaxID=2676871 RepID=UPI001ABE27F0|nr:hypothetical protein [Streptomyces sp. Tu 2975]
MPVNAVARLAVGVADRCRAGKRGRRVTRPPVRQPDMALADVRREAAVLLPGAGLRRLLFWRHLLVFREQPLTTDPSEVLH